LSILRKEWAEYEAQPARCGRHFSLARPLRLC
jgi:hypothetical protein